VAGLLPGSPTGAQRAWTGVQGAGRPAGQLLGLAEEKQSWYLKLGAILNTVQGSLVPDMTYNVFGGTLNPAQSNGRM